MDADFLPTASWPNLRLRAELLKRLRGFFDERGFLEVETPLASADVVVDRHLEPFTTVLASDPRRPEQGRRLFLQTSPEAAMKRLLAAGGEAIYQVTRSFRNGEVGARHNPEFTIVEWYRRGDTMAEGIELLCQLCSRLLGISAIDRLSYAEAFARYAEVDPHRADIVALRAAAVGQGGELPSGFETLDRDGWLNYVLATIVEPKLGDGAVVLYDFPASQAALARVRQENPPVAERFELYVSGVELANGYHELTDAAALADRAKAENAIRQSDGRPPLPASARLLAAMRHGLPDCTGCALGFDRLVMLAAGAKSINDVLAFPIDRA